VQSPRPELAATRRFECIKPGLGFADPLNKCFAIALMGERARDRLPSQRLCDGWTAQPVNSILARTIPNQLGDGASRFKRTFWKQSVQVPS
jgi:hypothetical protein